MIKLCYFTALSALLTLISVPAFSQSEEEAVKKTINNMFDGMRRSDTTLIRSSFAPAAIMQTVGHNKQGEVAVFASPVDSFIVSIGRPHKEVYDERISFATVQIDADLAIAWTPYRFYLDDQFLHCGVNSFQLVRLKGEWKIQYIIDTRRRQGCEK